LRKKNSNFPSPSPQKRQKLLQMEALLIMLDLQTRLWR
jgi:hypothetical protein